MDFKDLQVDYIDLISSLLRDNNRNPKIIEAGLDIFFEIICFKNNHFDAKEVSELVQDSTGMIISEG